MSKIILGNWKQNGSTDLLRQMHEAISVINIPNAVQVGILPPAIFLTQAKTVFNETSIHIGAQNISATKDGAYTGEISARMCFDVGCDYTLVGHSERREYFHETNEIVAKKFEQAALMGLIPVLCIGETLQAYEAGETQSVLDAQLSTVLPYLDLPREFIIAYEPVWAIGTGKAATKEYAQDIHAYIRQQLPTKHQRTPILYGGSVKPDNCGSFLSMPDVNGVLVGGASLIPESFIQLIQAAGSS